MAGDPCPRQIAIAIGDLALTDATRSALHCHGRHPQLLELASLTGGSQWLLHIAITASDLGSYRHWLWRVAH